MGVSVWIENNKHETSIGCHHQTRTDGRAGGPTGRQAGMSIRGRQICSTERILRMAMVIPVNNENTIYGGTYSTPLYSTLLVRAVASVWTSLWCANFHHPIPNEEQQRHTNLSRQEIHVRVRKLVVDSRDFHLNSRGRMQCAQMNMN